MGRKLSLKRLRRDALDCRYQTFSIEVPELLSLIDELEIARRRLVEGQVTITRHSESGEVMAVTRNGPDGEILSTIWSKVDGI